MIKAEVQGDKIVFTFKIPEYNNGVMFQPSGYSLALTAHNPLYFALKNACFYDNEIEQFTTDDFIGSTFVFVVKNREGESRSFCDLIEYIPKTVGWDI